MADRVISGRHLARLLGSWRTGAPAYIALADAIRLLVLDGRLPLRTRLPGERELAEALGLSRTTVTAAYARLRDEGYVRSRRASGSWTSLPAGAAPPATVPLTPGGDVLDLAAAAPLAPLGGFGAAVTAAVAELPRYQCHHGHELLGLPPLREALAARYTARGLPTEPEQIMVTNGGMSALALLFRLLLGPGDRVLVEHPTYANALVAITRASGRPVPVGLTEDGWDLDMFEATLRQAAPRLAYLIADFQNPTGHLMPEATRAAIAELAARTRTPLVVDETLAELLLDPGPMPPPVAAYHPSVITIGSASKSYWGGLRLGWIRAPRDLIDRLAGVRPSLDLGSPILEQLICTELTRHGDAALRDRRAQLAAQRDTLVAAVRDLLPEWRFTVPRGGLSLWIDLGAPVSTALAVAAERYGLRLAAGPLFSMDGAFARYLRLPYTLPEETLAEATERLATAYRSVAACHVPSAPVALA
ncbi:hypothetical protein C3Y87_09445 [Carbonactinospora thermoautotrophica]|uniref:MocR-like transcription factor YczR n=1 Tax=Carbonactinospora thermoautotrophica TaxID=1469144 RepID=UPI00226F19F2|nr:PLP-dependent aminotransferase family protein [Carbonactinospora thermoautotrophica]MCX9191635.1 hypothetical protein [Carbonactinospora thermoautotrophica]